VEEMSLECDVTVLATKGICCADELIYNKHAARENITAQFILKN
jgi:hypothetical protein